MTVHDLVARADFGEQGEFNAARSRPSAWIFAAIALAMVGSWALIFQVIGVL